MLCQPFHQRQVVGQPPEVDHRQVGVAVDQTRHEHAAAAVDDLRSVRGRPVRHRPQRGNLSAADLEPAGGVLCEVAVHRHDMRVGEQRMCGLCSLHGSILAAPLRGVTICCPCAMS